MKSIQTALTAITQITQKITQNCNNNLKTWKLSEFGKKREYRRKIPKLNFYVLRLMRFAMSSDPFSEMLKYATDNWMNSNLSERKGSTTTW